MKKKTKKQKIIADYRKKIELIKKITQQHEPSEISSRELQESSTIQKRKIINKTKSNTPLKNNTIQKEEYSPFYFKKDIKRTIIISLLIFTLEICIYYVMIKIT